METKYKEFTGNGCLCEYEKGFFEHLIDRGYNKSYFHYCRYVLKRLEQYMLVAGETKYTYEIGVAFLKSEELKSLQKPRKCELFKLMIRRFNDYIFKNEFVFYPLKGDRTCPDQFTESYKSFIDDARSRGLRDSTIENYCANILKALRIFDAAGIKSLKSINPPAIYAAFEQFTDKTNTPPILRKFLSHLFRIGIMETDLSIFVPQKRKHQPVPSVFTKNEIERFLNSFDTESKMGKRDYAITLLALRLGMRSSDIACLKISNIDFNAKTINFTQGKTQTPQRLELLPEIETALCAYLINARPYCQFENIFLTARSPVRPITRGVIRCITCSHLDTANINVGERKRGPHSLRMTLASELVSENVPYDAIRKILGHEDPNAIKHYVKFDIEGLRSCAIDVPPISGRLSDYIYIERGGI